ncbi:hypothetical protein MLD38_022379 [Melastoma candidum]|uniref:Uncharacterized protein n=1 Tax=Melastoma candidum TaxID=119954 RepID=A0ACB9QID8_9MYRT|nr:hypothetical protein MLD38_022379 [Melastoma candidum]
MDPCPYLRISVANLHLHLSPLAAADPRPPSPSADPPTRFCLLKLHHLPRLFSALPCHPSPSCSATFHLTAPDLSRLSSKQSPYLSVSVFSSPRHFPSCAGGLISSRSSAKMLGKVRVPLDLQSIIGSNSNRALVLHSGWVPLGYQKGSRKKKEMEGKLHLVVKAEPDPRFVFEFEGEPECSPQILQVQGRVKQPVFTCKFSLRSTTVADCNHRSRSMPVEPSCTRNWLSSFGSERERTGKERKGWSVTVHDLSGSPVAVASMVTPFVASPGTDRVSRSNPGSWLILRPGDGTWKPWGRLEAWRERGASDSLGYRFEIIPDSAGTGVVIAESTVSSRKGGKFLVDLGANNGGGGGSSNGNCSGRVTPGSAASPVCSPRGSGDYGHSLWPYSMYKGFVMSARVEGENKCSKPTVEVSVQHVNCTEDAAAYVALAAAIDLSMDACRLFSQRLRKELCQNQEWLG